MKKTFLTIIILAVISQMALSAKSEIVHLSAQKHTQTSFAVFVDSLTWEKCSKAISDYRAALGEEGLGTHIFIADWESPESVKDIILRLAQAKRQPLEGVVFIGDIPIVRIGGAQHLTTAFKMNEKAFPKDQSWVVSDRYYDDFDLSFDFVDSDSTGFYYRLSDKGSQVLQSDIYSARMLVPPSMDNRYERLKEYLENVVKAHKENNPLDNVSFYAGSGYNSDCLTIWRQKPIAWREYFPAAFTKASTNRFLNYRYGRSIMAELFQEMQRKDCDLMEFSEHGAPGIQYITSSDHGTDMESDLQLLRSGLRRQFKHYRGTEDEKEFLEEAEKEFGAPKSIFADSLYASDAVRDSIETSLNDLDLDRITKLHTGPRVIVFNACYNGSFYEDGYVAGCHLFNGGSLVAAQGNTVNVLQDKYEDEMMGILAAGVRIGDWQKGLPYLESHLLGDPTFRFAKTDSKFVSEYESLKTDTRYWNSQLNSDKSLHRAAALKKLYDNGASESSAQALYKAFEDDPSWQVRLEALHLLSFQADSLFTQAVLKAFNDPYERIRRMAARYASYIGDPIIAPALRKIIVEENDSQRVQFLASETVQLFDSSDKENLKCLNALLNGKDAGKISSIRFLRNYNLHFAIPQLLPVLTNENESLEVKMALAEALGWFNRSYRRDEIISFISSMNMSDLDPVYATELRKTLKRLKWE